MTSILIDSFMRPRYHVLDFCRNEMKSQLVPLLSFILYLETSKCDLHS